MVLVALGALAYSVYSNRQTARLRDELTAVSAERDGLLAELQRDNRRATLLETRSAQAEQRMAELQRKVDADAIARPMPPAKQSAASPLNQRALTAERMAALKPQLERGTPIKGAIVMLVDGKPVQRAVAFVMGQPMRIEGGDDGTYVLTPSLNADGSVRYAISVIRKDANGAEQTEALPAIIHAPWDGFALGGTNGKAIAFDPDPIGP